MIASKKVLAVRKIRQSVSIVVPHAAADVDAFLAVRAKKRAGQVELPGGKVEPGESPREAAVRELREETGIDVTGDGTLRLLTVVEYEFARMRWRDHVYVVEVGNREPCEGDAGPLLWATREELLAGTYGSVVQRVFEALDAFEAPLARGPVSSDPPFPEESDAWRATRGICMVLGMSPLDAMRLASAPHGLHVVADAVLARLATGGVR